MAITTLLTKRKYAKIDQLVLDCNIAESHEFISQIAQYPVEYGDPISDHIHNKPVVLTLEGLITNSPIKIFSNSPDSIVSIDSKDRKAEAFTYLTDLWEAKKQFDVISSLKVYRNMVLINLNIPRNQGTGEALRFTAKMTRIRKVKNEYIEMEDLKPDISDVAGCEVTEERKTVEPATEEAVAKTEKSWALSLKELGGKVIKKVF